MNWVRATLRAIFSHPRDPIPVRAVDAVHLSVAVLCISCQFVTARSNGNCALCGSEAVMNLQPALEHSEAQ